MSPSHLAVSIKEEVKKGRGIVPMIGAGVSADAGIPLTSNLPTHLWLCIGMALGIDGEEPFFLDAAACVNNNGCTICTFSARYLSHPKVVCWSSRLPTMVCPSELQHCRSSFSRNLCTTLRGPAAGWLGVVRVVVVNIVLL